MHSSFIRQSSSSSKLLMIICTIIFFMPPSFHFLLERPIVRTPNSIYIGKQILLHSGNKSLLVNQFTGIRYGLCSRFQRSIPAWNLAKTKIIETIDASKPANFCPQQSGFIEMYKKEFDEQLQTVTMSEDCLQLNIWIANNSNVPKPVLVWFHGGSFISDSISRLIYHGAQLAAQEDLIVVTINYRLDAFGFLYSGSETLGTHDNVALWDQLLALEWVQEHIEYFNGDTNRITVGGFDSGATSIGLHILSAKSNRFFKQAILMSGSIYSQSVNMKAACNTQVAQMWASMASKVSCGTGSHWTVDVVRCLQEASLEKILQLIDPLNQSSTGPEIIIGNELFPFDTLQEGLNQINSSYRNLTILIGSTNDEGSQILPIVNKKLISFELDKSFTRTEALEELARLSSLLVTSRTCTRSKVDGNEVARFYIPTTRNWNVDPALIGQAIGDFYISCPMVQMARQLALRNVQVYQYVWSSKVMPNSYLPCFDWMGACHGTDVLMLFGVPFMSPEQFSEVDREMSLNFMRTIGHFIHNGRPLETIGNKPWPAYEVSDNSLLMPYYQFIQFPNDSHHNNQTILSKFANNWKVDLCHNLWNKYLIPDV